MKTLILFFLVINFITPAKAGLIHNYCTQRQILANYWGHGKYKCNRRNHSEIEEKNIHFLRILNEGVRVRKDYAVQTGQTYTQKHINHSISEYFSLNDVAVWIRKTEKLKKAQCLKL